MSASDIKLRHEWDRFDTAAIHAALYRSHQEHLKAGNALAQLANPSIAYHRLVTGEQRALIVDGYLVVFDVTNLWSGNIPVVMEQYVVRLRSGGNIRNVVKALMAVAEAENCFGVAVGNASGDPRLSRFYEAAGFVSTGTQYFKEL